MNTDLYNPADDYALEAAMDKFEKDRQAAKDRPIHKGSVVMTRSHGWKRVTAIFKDTVNVCPVFGGRGRFSGIIKGIPKDEIFEDETAWYENWTHSETYQCM